MGMQHREFHLCVHLVRLPQHIITKKFPRINYWQIEFPILAFFLRLILNAIMSNSFLVSLTSETFP